MLDTMTPLRLMPTSTPLLSPTSMSRSPPSPMWMSRSPLSPMCTLRFPLSPTSMSRSPLSPTSTRSPSPSPLWCTPLPPLWSTLAMLLPLWLMLLMPLPPWLLLDMLDTLLPLLLMLGMLLPLLPMLAMPELTIFKLPSSPNFSFDTSSPRLSRHQDPTPEWWASPSPATQHTETTSDNENLQCEHIGRHSVIVSLCHQFKLSSAVIDQNTYLFVRRNKSKDLKKK